MFCPKCGTELPDSAAFCTTCGHKLEASAPAPAVTSAPETVPGTPAPAEAAPAATAPEPVAATAAAGGAAVAKKGPGKGLIIGIVAVVVVAIVAVVVAMQLLSPSSYKIDEATFPDSAMRTYVATLDADGNGELSSEEAAAVTTISFDGATEVTGLDKFPNLETLDLDGNDLSKVDVSGCSNLKALSVPSDTEVAGLDSTNLAEQWVVGSAYISSLSSYGAMSGHFAYATYDASGRVASVQEGYDAYTYVDETYEYDDNGNIAKITDEDGMVTTYEYDDNGNAVSSESSQNSHEYTVNDAGLLASDVLTYKSSDDTATTNYEINDLGKLSAIKYANSSGTNSTYSEWTYDSNGNPSTYHGGIGVYSGDLKFTVNNAGQCTGVEGTLNFEDVSTYTYSISYEYNDSGNLISGQCTTADGTTVSLAIDYDSSGRATKATTNSTSASGSYVVNEYFLNYERAFVTKENTEQVDQLYSFVPTYVESMITIQADYPYSKAEDAALATTFYPQMEGGDITFF